LPCIGKRCSSISFTLYVKHFFLILWEDDTVHGVKYLTHAFSQGQQQNYNNTIAYISAHLVMICGVKHTTNVPMKVLIFLVALCRLRFCSSKHFCRTLPKQRDHYLPRRHDQRHCSHNEAVHRESMWDGQEESSELCPVISEHYIGFRAYTNFVK